MFIHRHGHVQSLVPPPISIRERLRGFGFFFFSWDGIRRRACPAHTPTQYDRTHNRIVNSKCTATIRTVWLFDVGGSHGGACSVPSLGTRIRVVHAHASQGNTIRKIEIPNPIADRILICGT